MVKTVFVSQWDQRVCSAFKKLFQGLMTHQQVLLSGASDGAVRCWQMNPNTTSFEWRSAEANILEAADLCCPYLLPLQLQCFSWYMSFCLEGPRWTKRTFARIFCYFSSRPGRTKQPSFFQYRFNTPSVVVFLKRYPLHLRRHFWKRHSSSGAGRRSLGWWHLWCSLGHLVDIWVIPVYGTL